MTAAGNARRAAGWLGAASATLLIAALWVRAPSVPYLVACAVATVVTLLLTPRPVLRQRAALLHVLAIGLLIVSAALGEREAWRVSHEWAAYSAERERVSLQMLRASEASAEQGLLALSGHAAQLEDTGAAAFRRLSAMPELQPAAAGGERGVAVFEGDSAIAWAGTIRVAPSIVTMGSGASDLRVVSSDFYLALQATVTHGRRRAIAMELLSARPPADRFAIAAAQRVAKQTGGDGFELAIPGRDSVSSAMMALPSSGRPMLLARAIPLEPEAVLLHVREATRGRAAALLALAAVAFFAAAWRPASPLSMRLAAIVTLLATLAVLPLSSFSNTTRLFDPTFYFASLGGPYTANVGSLGITSGLLLLALLAVLRSRVRMRSRAVAAGIVIAIAGVAPFLLRALAKGIAPPVYGASTGLWLAWEVTIFLAATAVLLAGATAGSAALGSRRGAPPLIAPALALLAALLAPVVWDAPGQWPSWYPLLWVLAVAMLALSRRTAAVVIAAATVAGAGAATLVWGATARARVFLAQSDMASLAEPDQEIEALLRRFGEQLSNVAPPVTRSALLQRYVSSDLAQAAPPVAMATWLRDSEPVAELALAAVNARVSTISAIADSARRARTTVVTEVPTSSGTQLVLAVPSGDSAVTAVVVAPRTRLIAAAAFSRLLGLDVDDAAEPPYSLVSVPGDSGAPQWKREGSEMHGDLSLPTSLGRARVHAEVELRPLDALLERGALVVLLDLTIVGLLWLVNAATGGAFPRWTRGWRARWLQSFRARLTLALSAFFVIPAVVFAAWSSQRLIADDRQSRELLVREALRAASDAVAESSDSAVATVAGDRAGAPVFVFAGGVLESTSDPLLDALAPIGRTLRPDVQLSLAGGEVSQSAIERVDGWRALFGYVPASTSGARFVLAAPARSNDLALDRRRRDLGILVLFATAVGALAALALSGLAARQLSRPIGELRGAALAIAGGVREPPLAGEPPAEFQPVFSAFRRMASDLSASARALEEARLRVAAVLRNVASGVVAVEADGRISLANPRAQALLDVGRDDGAADERRLPPAIDAAVSEFLTSDREEEELELQLGPRQLRVRLTRLARAAGCVVTLDDVTELARAQRVLAWGEMARQIAHEIKNPLTPIRLGVQHLRRARADRRDDFDQILDQNVARILAEIDHLDEIARAFSRYGTGPDQAGVGAVDVAAVARDVVALERMGADSVDWQIHAPTEPVGAVARAEELREVLLNLLENARLASARHVKLEVSRADGDVAIRVTDDGEGIPADALPRIFEPHFSTRTSGSGLGLAISRRLVEGWGGRIGVSSEPGHGARVEIALRAADITRNDS